MRHVPPAMVVFVVSGLIGAVVGWMWATPSALIVPGQFLAGLAAYPEGSPMAAFFRQTITLPAEGVALLLRLGLSPDAICLGLSSAIAALYAQAFALITYSFSRQVPPALAVAALCCVSPWAYLDGPDYPIQVIAPHTSGILGLALGLHVLGMIGVGWYRAAAIVLGLMPFMHPVLGLWSVVVVVAGWVVTRRTVGSRVIWPFAFGIVGGAVALLAGRLLAPEVAMPPADPGYMEAFLKTWDFHRNQPFDWQRGTMMVRMVLLTTMLLLWLRLRRAEVPEPTVVMVWTLAAAAVGGAVAYGVFYAGRDLLPNVLVIAMPNRLINLPLAATLPVLAGLLFRHGRTWTAVAALAVLLAVPVGLAHTPFDPMVTGSAGNLAAVIVATTAILALSSGQWGDRWVGAGHRLAPVLALGMFAAALVVAQPVNERLLDASDHHGAFVDYVSDIGGPGGTMAVVSDVHSLGVPARKALLIDPNLDFVVYGRGLGPAMAAILADVYGVDFFAPRQENFLGAIHPLVVRPLWQARSLEQWQAIAARHDLRIVVTDGTWRLQLPLAATISYRGERLAVFAIPPAR
ncbi:MAG: hypothetical protein H7840_05495 [Alphaproteobacteria bacterium]